MQPSDDELVYRIRVRDEEAFELLFQRYKSMVYRYSHYLTMNSAEAEDLFQDTWLRVVKHLPSCGMIESLQSWICRITNLSEESPRPFRAMRMRSSKSCRTTDIDGLPSDCSRHSN